MPDAQPVLKVPAIRTVYVLITNSCVCYNFPGGDDTVLVICPDIRRASEVESRLRTMLES